MNRYHFFKLVLIVITLISLSGCLVIEQVRLQLDLSKRTGKIEYFNIVSAIEKKDSYWTNDDEKNKFFNDLTNMRDKDLKELVKEYGEFADDSNKIVTEKKLIAKNKQLNGIEKFNFSDLKGFDILMNKDSTSYFMKIENDTKYIFSNGTYFETDSGNYVLWDITTKKIDIKIQQIDLEEECDYTESMLSYWKEWKRANR
ncbi:hypothetical protein [Carboxylicivirga marina]|uniref:Uncharacterized protein n=1 Tax=Carboxylicivirga marina TaxID=2800988 RepID=A0ABS1HQ37_9BACT|nr:hypothetical protein [Carboxylicivirga marina]MBK3519797.1 hypothetical protein [Carboxylicivirga marina]